MNQNVIAVDCTDLDYVEWNNNCNYELVPGTTSIWRLPLGANYKLAEKLLDVLNQDERHRAGKYVRVQDTKRYILTRSALKLLLASFSRQPVNNIRLAYGADKKPFLLTNIDRNLHFNVSHSGDSALIALSDQPVGVDLEQINPQINYKEILDHYFGTREVEEIIANPSPLNVFYKFWTRKEALLKATGKGIIDELSGIGVLNGPNQFPGDLIQSDHDWKMISFPVSEGSQGSVATVSTSLQFFKLDFEELMKDKL